MPWGLWAASTRTVGEERRTSRRPGLVTDGETVLDDPRGHLAPAVDRLGGRQGQQGVVGLVLPVQRNEGVLVDGRCGGKGDHLAADGELAVKNLQDAGLR